MDQPLRPGPPPVALRIVRPYDSEDELIARESGAFTRTGIVLVGAPSRPEGVVLRFELCLRDGSTAFRGEGRVLGYRPPTQGEHSALLLRFTRLDVRSKALLDRALEARSGGRDEAVPFPEVRADSRASGRPAVGRPLGPSTAGPRAPGRGPELPSSPPSLRSSPSSPSSPTPPSSAPSGASSMASRPMPSVVPLSSSPSPTSTAVSQASSPAPSSAQGTTPSVARPPRPPTAAAGPSASAFGVPSSGSTPLARTSMRRSQPPPLPDRRPAPPAHPAPRTTVEGHKPATLPPRAATSSSRMPPLGGDLGARTTSQPAAARPPLPSRPPSLPATMPPPVSAAPQAVRNPADSNLPPTGELHLELSGEAELREALLSAPETSEVETVNLRMGELSALEPEVHPGVGSTSPPPVDLRDPRNADDETSDVPAADIETVLGVGVETAIDVDVETPASVAEAAPETAQAVDPRAAHGSLADAPRAQPPLPGAETPELGVIDIETADIRTVEVAPASERPVGEPAAVMEALTVVRSDVAARLMPPPAIPPAIPLEEPSAGEPSKPLPSGPVPSSSGMDRGTREAALARLRARRPAGR